MGATRNTGSRSPIPVDEYDLATYLHHGHKDLHQIEVLALLPLRHFSLIPLQLGALQMNEVVDKPRPKLGT
jgi:hypothetical protein